MVDWQQTNRKKYSRFFSRLSVRKQVNKHFCFERYFKIGVATANNQKEQNWLDISVDFVHLHVCTCFVGTDQTWVCSPWDRSPTSEGWIWKKGIYVNFQELHSSKGFMNVDKNSFLSKLGDNEVQGMNVWFGLCRTFFFFVNEYYANFLWNQFQI